jgi:hypothetical protein
VSTPTAGRPGRRPKLGERAPAFARMAIELREHVASFGTERVAEVLRVAVADLAPMLEGRVRPPLSVGMRRLRKLGGDREG